MGDARCSENFVVPSEGWFRCSKAKGHRGIHASNEPPVGSVTDWLKALTGPMTRVSGRSQRDEEAWSG